MRPHSQFPLLDPSTLSGVTGGAAHVTAHVPDNTAITTAMTKIKSDLDTLASSSKNTSSSSMQTMLPMIMMMKSRG